MDAPRVIKEIPRDAKADLAMCDAAKVRVTIGDDREEENAAFCAMAREALPYWIRLAQMREAALYQLRSGRSR